MTTPARGASLAPAVPAEEAGIAEYLDRHPEFFERNLAVLAKLRLPHLRGGTTISLVERQVEVLRERQAASDERLQEFIRVARANDALADKIQQLSRRLLRATSMQATLNAIETGLRVDFDAVNSRLVLPAFDAAGVEGVPDRFLRAVPQDEPALKSFETLFNGGKPRCGQVRDIQRDFLFGDEAATVGSVALVPLGDKGSLGLLAVGSGDVDRFHPGMSTEFLARMGELIADSIQRYR
ncbi:MAG: DUF484 family protein, partial [Gammaproteobacteria bacterium]|nr:DUF484 family protein [Gammaproteobacteria bacterium]